MQILQSALRTDLSTNDHAKSGTIKIESKGRNGYRDKSGVDGKVCSTCHRWKPLDDFPRDRTHGPLQGVRHCRCKACRATYLLGCRVLDISLCDTAGTRVTGGCYMANARARHNLKALPTSPSLAQTLPSDAVLDALKMILLGAPLNDVLTTITRLIEAHSTGMLCSIFLLDEDGLHLRYGVATSLPEAYRAATDGCCIGPNAGSCGSAAYLRQPVFVSDIASDPRWVKFRDSALQSGLRAAWSTPIMSHDGKVLGTFGMYYREVRHPGPGEIQLIDHASRIAGIAIERESIADVLDKGIRTDREIGSSTSTYC